MKKIDKRQFQILRNIRFRRRLRRARTRRNYIPDYNVKNSKQFGFREKIDENIIKNFKNPFFEYLSDCGFVGTPTKYISIDAVFSIIHDPDNAIKQLGVIQSSLNVFMGESITLDFTKCTTTDLHTLFVLRIIVNDYRYRHYKLQQRIYSREVITKTVIIKSLMQDVNKKLFAGEILNSITTSVEEMMPISTIGIHTGERSQKKPSENKKGSTATKIVGYVNENLNKYDYKLTDLDRNEMESLIAEVLNNAEDHGLNSKWYATATLFEDNRMLNDPTKEIIGELTITILNFGKSFYEGLEETKTENIDTYKDLEELYNAASKCKGGGQFGKGDYFTLYALQEGISRLKYIEQSRGTGTMKFINSFLSIGDYENKEKKYFPSLHILSGNTLLKCDNKFKSFLVDGDYCLSLNLENDLSIPPQQSHLRPLIAKFPGTVLAIKIYLNKNHLKNKHSKNDK